MPEQRTLAIAGAGIAGLATAIQAKKAGWEPVVFEKDPTPPAVKSAKPKAGRGGVLLLWTNGVKALRAVDQELYKSVMDKGTRVTRTEFRIWSEERLWELPMAKFEESYGEPSVLIRRYELLDALTGVASDHDIPVVYDHACVGYRDGSHGVVPLFEVGGEQTTRGAFDGLIGADGIHSRVRHQAIGAAPPRSAYHNAWIGISVLDANEWEFDVGHTVTYLGFGLRLCASTLKSDDASERIVYWYATEPYSEIKCESDGKRPKRDIRATDLPALFEKVSPSAARLLTGPADGPHKHRVQDHRPLRRWAFGRVTLAGDSAHACTPDLGQGACQALESAVALGRVLRETEDVSDAFRRYARRRMERAARVTDMSRMTALQSSISGPGVETARKFAIRACLPDITLREFEWLFSEKFG